MLTLAFDTATGVATTALVRDGDVLGERVGPRVRGARRRRRAGPRSRLGPARSRPARRRRRPRQLHRRADRARRRPRPGACAGSAGRGRIDPGGARGRSSRSRSRSIDARRGEIFGLVSGHARCLAPDDLRVDRGRTYVGDGAVRYRAHDRGTAEVSCLPTAATLHVPHARFHARLAGEGGPAEQVEPVYLELPMPRGRSLDRDPPAAASRPDRDRGDRAQRLSDAVVALDVRRRALEAVLGLPRRLRGADPAWLPDHLAVRRRLARDERRGRPGPAPAWASPRPCSAACSN